MKSSQRMIDKGSQIDSCDEVARFSQKTYFRYSTSPSEEIDPSARHETSSQLRMSQRGSGIASIKRKLQVDARRTIGSRPSLYGSFQKIISRPSKLQNEGPMPFQGTNHLVDHDSTAEVIKQIDSLSKKLTNLEQRIEETFERYNRKIDILLLYIETQSGEQVHNDDHESMQFDHLLED